MTDVIEEAKSRYRHFGEMAWPDPHQLDELAHRLAWAPESLTRSDHLVLTSVIGAYRQMIGDSRAKREAVCRALRKPVKEEA